MPYQKHKRPVSTLPTARTAALLSLLEVEKGGFPEEALEDFGAALERRDRALAAALVYGVLRWRSRLEWSARRFLHKPDRELPDVVRVNLNLGLFQLYFLDRVPASAAVNESVKLAKVHGPAWSPGLVNAVLRAAVRAGGPPDPDKTGLPPIEKLALTQAHPLWLVERWVTELGWDEAQTLLEANNRPAALSLRINTARAGIEEVAAGLPGAERSRFAPDGLLLPGPTGPVGDLPGFDQGLFTVQDEAAQVVCLLARSGPGVKVLDACAGRGGKSLYLAALTKGSVRGLDLDRTRLLQAQNEARRLGAAGVRLTQGDLLQPPFASGSFDLVLVDAPCSSLGVIRRRPDVKWLKKENDPARLSDMQTKMLAAAAQLVRPGGRLIYAVCTLTPEETDGVIQPFGRTHPDFELVPAGEILPESARPLADDHGLVRAWPHRHGTDGFFAAVLDRRPA
ncbi:MAG: 16S rRNA (cytosine(967)-C(5))-methyltransferase RsmB [Thermodesulfobacteriota bacterium]